ncbi:ABC-type Na+ efflux pump permease subunit [Peribacillus deserti]|uniref:ABC-type Na+ efflux pump permease subunit n=1 Tax=Peribacillus deserti TaxID=673318 RepID=A0ABS2QD81_9BACI|nr:ABC transporter permease subunit [Peribacillus deserti]MBM7691115.1 ABC-type Na+ efflux pump permease subunit [Peribacillus deserti]
MDKSVILTLVKKDIIDIKRSKSLFITLIVIPVIFCVAIPSILSAAALFADIENMLDAESLKLIHSVLGKVEQTAGLETINQQFFYTAINYFLPALFLLVPIITASVLGANSFVGEKERRTLESLLFSPISMKELFIGKITASFVPSFAVSAVSFLISGIIINSAGYLLFNEWIFPSANWIILILCLSPLVTMMTILINVIISSKVKTFQEAQNIGGVIVLPVIGMLVGQLSGVFFIGPEFLLAISIVIVVINIIMYKRITKLSDRNSLFENQIG